jgi:hypothetical protein
MIAGIRPLRLIFEKFRTFLLEIPEIEDIGSKGKAALLQHDRGLVTI